MLTRDDLIEVGGRIFPKVPQDKLELGVDMVLATDPIWLCESKEWLFKYGNELVNESSYFKRELVRARRKNKVENGRFK